MPDDLARCPTARRSCGVTLDAGTWKGMAAADRPARPPLGVAGSGGADRVRGAMESAYSLKAGQTLGHA